ncbi:unnamed protein product [Urochloa decumbens]|uniref:F-box domain-containing protein n=1 Tax=Urochloa decumbens TaxID=240449 RepID=A0ABC8YZZ4_9POAL
MAPFVPDDLLLQIFLRLPPQPSSLLRATLVCKRWRGLVADRRFLRHLRAPLLGVFLNNPPARASFLPAAGDPPDRVPASRFLRPPPPWLVRASRRGRVLLSDNAARFLVWDPVTNAQRFVPAPPVPDGHGHRAVYGFGAVLLRGDDVTDASFRVAVASVQAGVAVAAVYSSDTGAWSEAYRVVVTAHASGAPATGSIIPWVETPGAAARDAVYWLLDDERLLSLELHDAGGGGTGALAVVEPRNAWRVHGRNAKLMRTTPGGGELGLAAVTGAALRLWALEEAAGVSWTLRRTVLLDALLPGARMPRRRRCPVRFGGVRSLAVVLDDDGEWTAPPCARIVGVDEDGAVVFLRRMDGLFMLGLQPAPRIKQICESYYIMHQKFDAVYPFTGFFVVGNI